MVLDGAIGGKQETDNPNTRDYELFDLNKDMGEDDEWDGQPFITNPFDGDYGTSAFFFVNNHENEEKLRGKLNFKQKADEIEKVTFFEGSLGFEVIRSIKELEGEEVDGFNFFKIPFQELKEYINNLDHITVKVVNHTSKDSKGEVMNWNTFKVTKIRA